MQVDENLKFVIAPCLSVGFITFFLATVTLGLFDTAVMALMTSYAIDKDMNDGTAVFGPPTFHDSVAKIESA